MINTLNLERKHANLETAASGVAFDLKAVSEDGEFEGYASTFGNVDQGMDMVMAGAFAKTLRQKGNRDGRFPGIKLLRDHDTRQIVGEWLSLEEDTKGLKARGRLFIGTAEKAYRDAIALATETHTLMIAKAIDAMSIGYRTVKARWDESSGVRQLLELDLWEISVLPFPMNPKATVNAVKGDVTERDVERILREGGVPNSFAKMVAIHGYAEAKQRLGSRREAGSGLSDVAAQLRAATERMKGQ